MRLKYTISRISGKELVTADALSQQELNQQDNVLYKKQLNLLIL